ncbi:MAG: S41 family peptidase [Planctomycetes bacterium]|nr:S41 family peptidase [Planctomycetota bacterium]
MFPVPADSRGRGTRARASLAAAVAAACMVASAGAVPQERRDERPPDGASQRDLPAPRQDPYSWFDPLITLRALIVDRYVDGGDPASMQRAALDAMVRALGDPYSEYMPPEVERSFRDRLKGSYVGIGVELAPTDGRPVVITAHDDSPAMEAGIVPGDVVVAVDGRDTAGTTWTGLDSLLVGDEGSPVRLDLRGADGTPRSVAVTRRLIETPGVKGVARGEEGWQHVLDPDRRIAYVRIGAFNDGTLPELDAALARIRAGGVSGLVLDLRGNGGGSVPAGIGTADRFLQQGAIVSTRGRGGDGRTWDAAPSPDDVQVPLVVLVNEGSASATEFVAGALRDHGRAKLVGTRSFGKGSVQEVLPMPDGVGAVKLSVERYFLPSGDSVSRKPGATRWGVEPDTGFRVPMDASQQRAATVARQAREAPPGSPASARAPAVRWASPESVRKDACDPQLAAALEAMQGYLDAGEWPVVGAVSGDVGAGSDELRSTIEERRMLMERMQELNRRISGLRGAAAGVEDPLLGVDATLVDGELTLRDREGRVIGRWTAKDPAALLEAIRRSAVPAPEFTPAGEPESK